MVQDVLLVGFGAVGAIYAMVLQRSGLVRVTVVARSNFAQTKEHGCTFKSWKYGEITGWKPDRIFCSVEEAADRQYSHVFVVTKAVPELLPTSQLLSPLISAPYIEQHEQPVYVLLQNGMGIELDLYHAANAIGKGEPKIISAAVYIGTNLKAPNYVVHEHHDKIVMGVYRHEDLKTDVNTPEEAALLEGVASLLRAGGSEIEVVSDVQRKKFVKNLFNITFASIATLTRYATTSLFRAAPSEPGVTYSPYISPSTSNLLEVYTIPAIRAVLGELITLGYALGFPDSEDGLPPNIVDACMDLAKGLYISPTSTHKPSMMLDMENDRPMEVEVIVGNVLRMGKGRGLDLPRVEMIYALLLVVQNQILRKKEEASQMV